MNPKRINAIILCLIFAGYTAVRAQDMDTALSKLTEDLAAKVKEHGNKKITVLDFTDLQGQPTEMGRYVAEQITVNLVLKKREFTVLDRSNLKSILAEHKLTTTGLVNPENAKKLGQFAGVDALVLGTIVPRSQRIAVTAEIISTETAEIIGGAKTDFKAEDTVQQLMSKPTAEVKTNADAQTQPKQAKTVSKSFGDLSVELAPLQIVNGNQYQVTLNLKNQNPKKSIWVAMSTEMDFYNTLKASLLNSEGNEFNGDRTCVTGIEATAYAKYSYQGEGFDRASEIKPGDSISATIKFKSRGLRPATAGQCRLQLEFLLSYDFSGGHGTGTAKNLVTSIETE